MTVPEIASTLVRIPSVNPDGDPGTDKICEARCAEWLAEFLSALGAKAELREVFPGRPNIVARFPSDRPGKPRILFAPHTDTVSVTGMTIDPFSGEIRAGRLHGRGASDTKGPMASMLWALREALPMIPSLPYEIWFAGLMGEEAGQHGAKALAAQEEFAFVIAGEPTGLDVVHAHKGSVWMTLETTGVAVHGSLPHTGVNAIYKMCDALEVIRREVIPSFGELHNPVLGHPTASVGTVAGGSKTNIVADSCRATVDLRTIPGQDLSGVEAMIRAKVPDIQISSICSLPLQTDPAHPLIQKLQMCGSALVGAPWFCDAAVFAARGCPAIALGPGSLAQAHTCDEFISLEDLEKGGDFFLRFLHSLGSAG
ncbi:MAG: M20 family metallopeptidase [Chthoniobacterales bacterium]|nr:M20 family metallopeptidase [Chthoniobacterales bacterium]